MDRERDPSAAAQTLQLPQAIPGPEPVPARSYGRIVWGVIALVVILMLLRSLAANENMRWDVVGYYFTSESVLRGLLMTLWLTLISMTLGLVLGAILAVMRLSENYVLNAIASGYIWFFRGTPLLVQLIFWYNLSALYPKLSLHIPFTDIGIETSTNSIITPFMAAALGLILNEAAYMAEIVRGGILSVDQGQREAAASIGMPSRRIFIRIVMPQAMRSILPPTGNQTIGMLKATSLVSVLAMPDLLYSVQIIYASNYLTIPLLVVACIWYLIVTSILSVFQYLIERKYAAGVARTHLSLFGKWLDRRYARQLAVKEQS